MDGALVMFGGALLLTPGFLSDILGLSLLLPPSRAVIRRILLKRFAGRVAAAAAGGAGPRMFAFGAPPRPPRAYDDDIVDSSATDVDPRRGELP